MAVFGVGCAHQHLPPPSPPVAPAFRLYVPAKEHLSNREIYKLTDHVGLFEGMHKAIGSFVTLDVVVKIQGENPLVAIVPPPDSPGSVLFSPTLANLTKNIKGYTLGTSDLKEGQRYRIEGLVMDVGGYGGYAIYLFHAQPLP